VKKRHPLRRIMLCTAATVSGVVLLLALKQPADSSATAAAQAPAVSGSPSASAAASQNSQNAQGGEGAQQDAPSSGPLPTKTAAGSGANSGAGSGASKSSGSAAAATKSVTGDSVDAQYGAVQVKLTVSGGKITKAETLQAPTTGPGGAAVPTLNQEVVTANSASIDAVSGASYTSAAYKKSLQSAIDKAGL
jgi:uncharacterized protein with FMN-binding domain